MNAVEWSALSTFSPSIICYDYPRLGVEMQDTQTTELGIRDISEGTFYRFTESGSATTEGSTIYSFRQTLPEAGTPPTYTLPSESMSVAGITLMPQEKANWCAAASCAMILAFHKLMVAQTTIAKQMNIPDDPSRGGASSLQQLVAWNALALNKLTVNDDEVPTIQKNIDELTQGRPFKHGRIGHARVVGGWVNSTQGVLYEMYDPWPVGTGAHYFENPMVVTEINAFYARRI